MGEQGERSDDKLVARRRVVREREGGRKNQVGVSERREEEEHILIFAGNSFKICAKFGWKFV